MRIHHRASGGRFDHVLALLYDGNPEQGGKLLDMDIIPRIDAEERFVVPFSYVPRTCGLQMLFVQTIPTDGWGAPVTSDVPVTVDCPSSPTITVTDKVHGSAAVRTTQPWQCKKDQLRTP